MLSKVKFKQLKTITNLQRQIKLYSSVRRTQDQEQQSEHHNIESGKVLSWYNGQRFPKYHVTLKNAGFKRN